MELFLIRHPEPDVPEGICYGRSDIGLAEDAAVSAARLRGIVPAGIPVYTSPLLLLALLLTWLYEKSGNLLAPISAHVAFNALNFVVFFSDPWLSETLERLRPWPAHP